MGCDELRRLLATDWGEDECLNQSIATHIRTCPRCVHGLIRLTKDLEKQEVLAAKDNITCEQCRAALPEYYEATRPDFALVEMPARELARVAYHLSHCNTCSEEYEVLLLLAELEERDEIGNP